MAAPPDPLDAARPRSLAGLRSTIDRLVPSGLPDAPRPEATLPPSSRPESPTRIATSQYAPDRIAAVPRGTSPVLTLPYPAVVYRAAADLLFMKLEDTGLGVCVATGPHVPGADCPVITIIDLLRGVADALDPPA